MLAMIDAYQHGDIKKAQQLHIKMFPIMTGLFFITSPIPVKTAMNLLGLPGGAFRLPITKKKPPLYAVSWLITDSWTHKAYKG